MAAPSFLESPFFPPRIVWCSLFQILLDFGLWMIHIQLCLYRVHATGRVGKLLIINDTGEGKLGDVEKSINQSLRAKKQLVFTKQLVDQFGHWDFRRRGKKCQNYNLESDHKWHVSEICSVLSDSLQPHRLYSPWNSPGQNSGVGSLFLLQGIFPTQGLNPGLPHGRRILYQLSHKGSPRTLEWVAYPFFRGYSWTRNRTGVSCIAGRFFTNWAIREAP